MWLYEGKEYDPTLQEILDNGYQGFVYLIENLQNGRKYVGKKFLVSPKILPKTKSRPKRKRTLVESDWRDYYGSSKELQEDVTELGTDNFQRTILHFCRTKGECSYLELVEQVNRNVLTDPAYYNNYIGCKIHSKHLPKDNK